MSEQGLLVIAPHPDDETLAAGGTIARCAAAGLPVTILTVAAHMPPLYSEAVHQQTVAEARRAHGILGVTDSRFLDLPAVYVSDQPVAELNGAIAAVVEKVRPSVVLCPYPDRHVDRGAGEAEFMLRLRLSLVERQRPHVFLIEGLLHCLGRDLG